MQDVQPWHHIVIIPGPLPTSARQRIRGVYAITPDQPDTTKLVSAVSKALAGGVRLVQFRNKLASRDLAWDQAKALRLVTQSAEALLIINDDIELAVAVDADGVHLGRDDFRSGGAPDFWSSIKRSALSKSGRQFLVGLSCYDDFSRAESAYQAGADYIAFGSFFPSTTKPNAAQAHISVIQKAKRTLSLPVVAIGGITVENAPQLLAAGTDSIAVIASLFDADNVRARAQQFTSLFPENV